MSFPQTPFHLWLSLQDLHAVLFLLWWVVNNIDCNVTFRKDPVLMTYHSQFFISYRDIWIYCYWTCALKKTLQLLVVFPCYLGWCWLQCSKTGAGRVRTFRSPQLWERVFQWRHKRGWSPSWCFQKGILAFLCARETTCLCHPAENPEPWQDLEKGGKRW